MASFNGLRLGLRPFWYPNYFTFQIDDGWLMTAGWYSVDYIFRVPEACSINAVGILAKSWLGDPDFPEFEVGIRAVDGYGVPTGAYLASGYVTFDTTAKMHWVTITPSLAVQRGQIYALCARYHSGPCDYSHNAVIYQTILGSSFLYGKFPYTGHTDTTRHLSKDQPIFGYKSVAGGVYGRPVSQFHRTQINYPKQQAMRFLMPDTWGETFKLAGVRWVGSPQANAGHEYDLILYEGTVELQRVRVYPDQSPVVSYHPWASFVQEVYFDENDLPELSCGVEYFLAIAPTSETSNLILTTYGFVDAADRVAMPGGENNYFAEREQASDPWTTDGAKLPIMDLILDEWGKPAAPGAGLHVNVFPRFNSNRFVSHADDQINDVNEDIGDGEPYESLGFPIGDAVKPYGGFATVEVFLDPDTDFTTDTRLFEEMPIEQLKVIGWENMLPGLYHLVFRFRSVEGSIYYKDYSRYMRVL